MVWSSPCRPIVNLQPINDRDADGREDEDGVDDGLPHDAGFSICGVWSSQITRFDEGAQQVDG